MLWKFERGIAKLRSLSELKHLSPCMIPQHFEDLVPISLKSCYKASEMLRVFTCPSLKEDVQLEKILTKAEEWTESVRTSQLGPRT